MQLRTQTEKHVFPPTMDMSGKPKKVRITPEYTNKVDSEGLYKTSLKSSQTSNSQFQSFLFD